MVKRQGRTGKPYNVAFSSKRLKGRIVEVYGSAARFAAAMGMSKASLSGRLTGRTPFLQGEIWYACILLQIKKEEIGDFFFCPEERGDGHNDRDL